MYQPYKFQSFLDRVKDLHYPEMIKAAEEEAQLIDGGLYQGRGRRGIRKEYRNLALEYRRLPGGFLFFLRYGIKPNGVSNAEFHSFKPAIESLVQKGQRKSEILNLFKS